MQFIRKILKKSHQDVYRSLSETWLEATHDNDLEYHSFRAALHYFRPELVANSKHIFNKIKINRLLSEFELGKESLFDHIKYHFKEELDLSSPKIFCTFHYGSFAMIHSFLAKNNLSYSLLLNDEYFNNQGSFYTKLHNSFRKRNKYSYHFGIINAEGQGTGIKLARNIKEGNHLVGYIDGNTGAGGLGRQDDRLIEVEFFGKKIHVRKGIAYLSHALNVPIVPVISYRSDYTRNGIHIETFSEIRPDKSSSMDEYVKKTTQDLYSILESNVKEEASQWECWLSIGNAINKEEFKKISIPEIAVSRVPLQLKFNSYRYGLVSIEGSDFLFDIKTYELRELQGSAHSLITNSIKGITSNDYPDEILIDLCKSEILIPFNSVEDRDA